MRFYSDFSGIPLIFIMLSGFAQTAFSNEQNLVIHIQGHGYQAVISENLMLKRRLSGISQGNAVKHYTGVLRGIANS